MSKEIIMAETTVAEAEAPVQTPDKDVTDTVKGVEKFLAEARNRGPNDGDDHLPPGAIRPDATPPDRHDAGGAAGGGGERGRGPEGPRNPEWLKSPERGRAIVKEIVRLEATLPYTERYRQKVTDSRLDPEYLRENRIYAERDGMYLDQLYKDLQDYTRAVRRERNKRDPWNPINAYREIKRRLEAAARGETISDIVQQLTGRARDRGERPPVLPAESLHALFEKYKGANLDAVEGDLATYFQEARALGLLDRADAIFTATYRQITQGNIPADQVEEMLEKNSELAKRAVEGAFRARRTDPNVARLQRIAEAYSTRTADIFQLRLIGEYPNPIEGEFRFGENMDEEEDTETYWRPGHYKAMYEIIAKTKKQFTRAKDSFLRGITGGALGKSPDELYEYFNNFTGMFGQTASAQGIDDDYVKASRLELTGHGYTFGADYSFETYNMKSANQFLMAKALHEGPEREVALARSANGEVAPHLWKFDYDPRVILLHNPGGSRGQLLSDTVTQHYLHQEIRNILIEEGMGVVMKNYRSDVQDLTDNAELAELARNFNRIHSELEGGRRLNELSEADENLYITALPVLKTEAALRANVERIGIHQKVEEFKGLYEGFDDGGAHRANFIKFGDMDQKKLPSDLRRSVTIGKVQLMLRLMLQGREGKDKKQLLGVIDELIAENRLTDKDKRIWGDAYDQSEANFKTAFQMVGAMGEKARRGGGVFFVDRVENGRRFVDNVPVYLAEKWVQYFENRCKIQYANEPAEIRAAAQAKFREIAIRQFKEKGYEAKLQVPKLVFDTNRNSRTFGDVIGIQGTEIIDFDAAVKSILSRWTNHTYWGYQQENRHMLTDPDVFAAAKRIRAGISKPEDEDNLATLLLIVDPTLKRVARLEDTQVREGESAMQQEIILFEAAVEASNIGHWRIVRDLSAAFMPEDGNPFKMRTGYNLEDYAGIARFIIRMRQYIAAHPKRFARRYAAEIANLPMNVSSMPDQWGQEGVMGAIEMFADPIGKMAEQGEASQFASTKWVDQMRIGNMLFGALVGQVDSERGFSIEGLFEKPTNNSDKLVQQIWDELKGGGATGSHEEWENKFFYAVMESFDRLWTVLKLVRTMESDTRNAQGALDLEKTDVFLADGKVNPDIALDRDTGTSRHTERIFFDKYINWLLSDEGGKKSYPSEARIYKFLREKYYYFNENGKKKYTYKEDGSVRTWADWLFDKMAR